LSNCVFPLNAREGIFYPGTKPGASKFFSTADDYFQFIGKIKGKSEKGVIALLTSEGYIKQNNIEPEARLVAAIEEAGFTALPVFAYTIVDSNTNARGQSYAIKKFLFGKDGNPLCDALIKLTSFSIDGDGAALLQKLNCPVFKPVLSYSMTQKDWENSRYGAVSDIAWNIALPETEGTIEPVFVSYIENAGGEKKVNAKRLAVPERIQKVVGRCAKWIALKRKSNGEKKLAFILNNNPCESVEASVGSAANLDALESVVRILRRLKNEGYTIEDIPKDGRELSRIIMERKAISEFRWTSAREIVEKGGALCLMPKDEYLNFFNSFSEQVRRELIEAWGEPPGEEKDGVPPAMLDGGKIVITGLRFGNALVCVQPKRGCAGARCDGTVCKILHDPLVPPTHQYIATYKYIEHIFRADALIHVGTHGSMEFLPGKSTGLSENCYPDICAGNMPLLYLYNSDNPPEGTTAKRRALAVIVDHKQTLLKAAGLYDELENLDFLLARYERNIPAGKERVELLEDEIVEAVRRAGLEAQISLENYHGRFNEIMEEAHKALSLIKNSRVQDGEHIFGEVPQGEDELDYVNAIIRFESAEKTFLRAAVAKLIGLDLRVLLQSKEKTEPLYNKNRGSIINDLDLITKNILRVFFSGGDCGDWKAERGKDGILDYKIIDKNQIDIINSYKERVLDIRERLAASREADFLASALNGNFLPPGPAGVVTRGRDDVLPTGRNFYTLDPRTIPTRAANKTGVALAEQVIEQFKKEEGRLPENFSMYWMCNDIMWAEGEGLAQLLRMLGVRPKWLSSGRVEGFEIIPLAELGRPRIDITVKISGILRDSFPDCVVLLDNAVKAVAALDESEECNYIKKHCREITERNAAIPFDRAASRVFGSKPGTYASGVSLAVQASAWKERRDMLDLFTYFNGYSFSADNYGAEAYKQLQDSLSTVDIAYNKIVSDEHDLLSCCCYFGNHGGLIASAKELSKKEVKLYYGDSRELTNTELRTLSNEIRRVARAKVLNPQWIEGQKKHGYAGASNITKRLVHLYGWEASTGEVDDNIFDDITKTFIVNKENKQFFMENNPWALEEVSRRLLEANERKLWRPADGLLDEIRNVYMEIEGFMEDDMGDNAGDFQGGSIDVVSLNEVEGFRKNIAAMQKILEGD